MNRVLITGSNGFIGRHCLPFLFKKDFEMHAVVSKDGMRLEYSNVEWHSLDLLDHAQTRTLIKEIRPTHLLHFAWCTQPGLYWSSIENLQWIRASLEILQAFKLNGGRRVLMAGTCAEYDWDYRYCSEQITPLKPKTLYGTCKKSLYEILMAFAYQENLSAAWGRIFHLYGPYEHPSRLVPSIINHLLKGQPAPCTLGNQIRDFLHVEDVASAFVTLLDSNLEGAVNIASGEPIALKKIILQIAEILDRPDLVQFGAIPTPETEPPLLVADVNRLRRDLDWVPGYDISTGLKKTIDWWSQLRTPV